MTTAKLEAMNTVQTSISREGKKRIQKLARNGTGRMNDGLI